MLSKRSKPIIIILWLVSALLITAGLTVLSFTFGAYNSDSISETTAEKETTTAATTTVPDGTMEGTVPDVTTRISEHGTEMLAMTGDNPPAESEALTDGSAKPHFVLRTLSVILLVIGAASAVFYIFVFSAQRPVFGADISLLLLFGSTALMIYFKSASMPLRIPVTLCGTALSLALLRELWGWIIYGAPLKWSAAHRLGRAVSSEHYSRYMIFQLIWTLLSLCCAAACVLITVHRSAFALIPLSVIFAVMFVISFLLLIRLCRDTDHLADQIERLHRGDDAEAVGGVFEDAERCLIDMRRQRDEAVRSAVADERFKVELISNVSHDLRTPLTSILGYGELLTHEDLSPKGKMQLERLNQKAGYMRDLVDELFELTKVSSGTVQAKREQIDLIRLLEQTLGLFDDRLTSSGLAVRRHYVYDSIPVISDGARLHQVFANLIGNAVKYSMRGTRIHIEARDDGDCYTVRITNIASYEMDFSPDEVMQRFYRGDKSRSTEGSGLGLAIAKTYSESVGGKFSVEIDGEQFSALVNIPKIPRQQN